MGVSLLVFTPIALISLRQEALSVRDGPAVVLEVVAEGGRFTPGELRVPAGANVRIDLVNNDPASPHDFQTFRQRRDARVVAWPGERRPMVFKAADRPGRYVFACTVRGHSGAGEAGTIRVEERSGMA